MPSCILHTWKPNGMKQLQSFCSAWKPAWTNVPFDQFSFEYAIYGSPTIWFLLNYSCITHWFTLFRLSCIPFQHLNNLLEYYLEPLKRETFLSNAEITALFGNIQEIFTFQRQFLQNLEEALELEPDFHRFEHSSQFKVSYLHGFHSSIFLIGVRTTINPMDDDDKIENHLEIVSHRMCHNCIDIELKFGAFTNYEHFSTILHWMLFVNDF